MTTLNINRERLGLLRAIDARLVEERRTNRGTEAIRRAPLAGGSPPLRQSNWRWKRCGPAVRQLITAGLVADLVAADGDPGPWTYQLTEAGQEVLAEHSATAGGRR